MERGGSAHACDIDIFYLYVYIFVLVCACYVYDTLYPPEIAMSTYTIWLGNASTIARMPYTFSHGALAEVGEHMKKSIKRIMSAAEKVEMAGVYIFVVGAVYVTALAYMYSAAQRERKH